MPRFHCMFAVLTGTCVFGMVSAARAQALMVRYPPPDRQTLSDVAWTGSLYVAVGGEGTIQTSPDGAEWTVRNSGTQAPVGSIAWSGTQLMAVGYNSGVFVPDGEKAVVMTSPDGITWTRRSAPEAGGLTSVVWAGDRFVIAGTARSITSPDGLSWLMGNWGSPFKPARMVWTGQPPGTFPAQIIGAGHAGALLTSPDGITWTSRTSGLGVFTTNTGLVWTGAETFLASSGYELRNSEDGVTWSTLGSRSIALNSLAWSGTRFVAGAGNGLILGSVNGVDWDTTVVSEKISLNVRKAGNLLFAFGRGGALLTSPDGITWTVRRTSRPVSHLGAVIWTGTQFVAVGENGLILTSQDGGAWTERNSGVTGSLNDVTWTGSQLVAVGGTNRSNGTSLVLTSPDGITWTQRNAGSNSVLSSVSAMNGTLVAVGDSNTVLSSANGIDWTLRGVPSNGGILNSITNNGSLFVAVGRLGTVLTSSDGIAWAGDDHTPVITPADNPNGANDLNYVTWVNNGFIAKGSKTFRSPDGSNWTLDTAANTAAFPSRTQAWNGVRYISVGNGGLILSAPQIPALPVSLTGPEKDAGWRARAEGLNLRLAGSMLHAEIPPSLRGRPTRASIFTLSGEKIRETSVTETAFSMDVRSLPRGLYVLDLHGGSLRVSRPFAIAR